MDWTKENTAERVMKIMKGTRRKQKQLAAALRVHPVTFNRWINGHCVPAPEAQERLNILEQYLNRKQTTEEDNHVTN